MRSKINWTKEVVADVVGNPITAGDISNAVANVDDGWVLIRAVLDSTSFRMVFMERGY